METYSLEDLKARMGRIANSWHPTVASGDQAAGRTLENLLGVAENNISLPDFGEIEIKTQKSDSVNYISLFTKEPGNNYGGASIPKLINAMGWRHENAGNSYPEDEKVVSFTISPSEFTNRGMTVDVDDEKIYVRFDKDQIKRSDPDRSRQRNYANLGEWYDDINNRSDPHYSQIMPLFYDRAEFEKKLIEKLNNTFLCFREKGKKINNIIHFKYTEGFILQNIKKDKISDMYKRGLFIDIGARTNHNHGTKLRMYKENLYELFERTEKIF